MVNVGSFLLIIILIWRLRITKNFKDVFIEIFTVTAFVELTIERGYFIQIGTHQIAYRTICETLLFLISIAMITSGQIKVKKNLAKIFLYVLLSISIGILLLIAFPSKATGGTMNVSWDMILVAGYERQPIVFNSGMSLELIQLSMYLVISLCAYSLLNVSDWNVILRNVVHASRIIVYIGILEFLLNLINGSSLFYNTVDSILGTSMATMTSITYRGSRFSLCGLTKEASHYVFILSIIFILNLSYHKFIESIGKKDKKYFFIQTTIIMLLILAMSFSAYYFIAWLFLLLAAVRIEKRGQSSIKFIIISFATLLGIVIIINMLPSIANILGINSFLGRRIYSAIEEITHISNGTWLSASTALEWSNRVRIGSTYETFKLLLYRPIFGLGFASTSAHSAFAMLVSGLGIVGTWFYLRFMMFGKQIKLCNYNNTVFNSCVIVYLIMNIFNSLGLRPFYEIWTILLFMSFQYVSQIDTNITKKTINA